MTQLPSWYDRRAFWPEGRRVRLYDGREGRAVKVLRDDDRSDDDEVLVDLDGGGRECVAKRGIAFVID